MMFSQSPCLDCSKRHVGCHANCATYCQWKREEAEKNEMIQKSLQLERAFDEVRAKRNIRIQRMLHNEPRGNYRFR